MGTPLGGCAAESSVTEPADVDGAAHLVWEGALRTWTPAGYGLPVDAPGGPVRVLTPRAIVDAVAAVYRSAPPGAQAPA